MLRVLIVDEFVVSYNELLFSLENSFNCISYKTSAEALQVVNDFKPDIILLDINTPDMNGMETCKKFTSLDCGKIPVVVFISASDDLKTKIKAYDAGGHDFIVPPFSTEELIKKLKSIGVLIRERDSLKTSVADTQNLAMTSMKQASQYGYIMNFFKNLYHCNSLHELAILFFDAMAHWELKASLAIRLNEVHYFDSATVETVSPIERKIFVALADAGRLYEFGQRIIVNDKHASFLIKNIPDDPAAAGEVRDIIAAVIEGLEAKVIDLKRQNGLDLITLNLTKTIDNVKGSVISHSQLVSSIMTDMMGAVSSSFHSLELTESQESFFHDLFEQCGKKMMSVEPLLLDIQEQLSLLSNHVVQLIDDTTEEINTEKSATELELF